MNSALIEIVGYVATALIVISLSMKSIFKLRVINMSGAILFAFYGAVISSLPVVALNTATACLNLFHLNKLRKKNERFEILEARSVDEPLMQKFLNYYRDDIVHFFGIPDLKYNKEYIACYILRNMVPAGIFIGEKIQKEGKVDIDILVDYVTPEFRDLKNSKFLFFGNKEWLEKHQISSFSMTTANETHQYYLEKIGFSRQGSTFYLNV